MSEEFKVDGWVWWGRSDYSDLLRERAIANSVDSDNFKLVVSTGNYSRVLLCECVESKVGGLLQHKVTIVYAHVPSVKFLRMPLLKD